MGALYIDTGGATTNSGSSDNNAPDLSGTGDAVVTGSTVQLTLSTDLSAVDATAGSPTQATIYIADATNTNQKIFWITGKNDGLDQVTVSVAPTGVTASNWAIGGRMVLTPANYEAALRAGDTVIFNNSPASSATDVVTARVAGDNTSGFVKWKGKTGVRPVITCSSTPQAFEGGIIAYQWIENLEFVQAGASGTAVILGGAGPVAFNIVVSDAGGVGVAATGGSAGGGRVIASEIKGTVADDGIAVSGTGAIFLRGNNIHDVGGDGIETTATNANAFASFNVIDTCAGRGISFSAAVSAGNALQNVVADNTIYGCGNSGLEVADADQNVSVIGNIFSENGNAAGEYNVEWVAGAAEMVSFHGWNVFYHSGGGGGANLSNLTVNAQVASSEFTTDPQFTDAAGANFSIASGSPAKATGFPGQLLGGNLGYLDIGVVQRLEAGGGLIRHPGMTGGLNG